MAYQVPPDVEQRLKDHMADGRYESEADVLRDAIRALDLEKSDVAAIQAGVEDMKAGRVKSFEDFDQEFRSKHNIACL